MGRRLRSVASHPRLQELRSLDVRHYLDRGYILNFMSSLGGSAPQTPRILGGSAPQTPQKSASGLQGTWLPWYHGTMLPWYHGTMVPWYHGTMVPWYHGTMVPWYNGTMVP